MASTEESHYYRAIHDNSDERIASNLSMGGRNFPVSTAIVQPTETMTLQHQQHLQNQQQQQQQRPQQQQQQHHHQYAADEMAMTGFEYSSNEEAINTPVCNMVTPSHSSTPQFTYPASATGVDVTSYSNDFDTPRNAYNMFSPYEGCSLSTAGPSSANSQEVKSGTTRESHDSVKLTSL